MTRRQQPGYWVRAEQGSFAEAPSAVLVEDEAARGSAISNAAYALLVHRFARSPGAAQIRRDAEALMSALRLDIAEIELDASGDIAASFGRHIADCYIRLVWPMVRMKAKTTAICFTRRSTRRCVRRSRAIGYQRPESLAAFAPRAVY